MDDEPTGAADEDATAAEAEAAADGTVDEISRPDAEVVSTEAVGRPDPLTATDSDDPTQAKAVQQGSDVREGDGISSPDEIVEQEGDLPGADGESSPADEIIELPWDDDLPVALGEETNTNGRDESRADDGAVDGFDDLQQGDGDGDEGLGDAGGDGDDDTIRTDEYFARRRRETRRGLDSWRTRSATGAIASAIAMGLQQVFEPEKRRPAAVAEAPSDPYADDDPVTVEYVPDDAEATTVRVKPWLLQKGDPA